jgi:hypothetical protein
VVSPLEQFKVMPLYKFQVCGGISWTITNVDWVIMLFFFAMLYFVLVPLSNSIIGFSYLNYISSEVYLFIIRLFKNTGTSFSVAFSP